MSGLDKFVDMLRSHYTDGCTVRFGAKYAAAIVAEYDALKARAESARCEPVEAGGCAPPVVASAPRPVPAAFRRHYPDGNHSGWYDARIESELLTALQASENKNVIEFAYFQPVAAVPAIDIGKLRELVSEWRNDAKHKVIRVMAKQQLADADQLAALIGDGGEAAS